MTEFVKGAKELQKRLNNLEAKMQHKVLAQSLRRAFKPVQKDAVQNAPKGTEPHKTYKGRVVAPGFLKQNIKLKKMKIRDKRFAGYTLAARDEAWYGQLIEIGWKPGKRSKVDADPWLGEAWQSNKSQMQRRLINELLRKIERVKK